MSTHQTMHVTAHHMLENLATGLYESEGQRVMELIRNGLVASMPDPHRWEPKRAKIEISLVANHPLGPRNEHVLIVLDHGCGLTDAALERYFSLGRPIPRLTKHGKGSHGGASQKGIGRLAALALNRHCLPRADDEDSWLDRIKHGFYILSRTSDVGVVRFIRFTPEDVELGQIDRNRFISDTATEMGPLKGINGSFTAIVIPTPIFKSHQEVYDAIQWFLPREHDKMFPLFIGGKAMLPPPLEDQLNITSEDGGMRVRIGPWKPKLTQDPDRDGPWLCDAQTGFRIASCVKIGKNLPAPLWYTELTGDIFCPGLLENQNTARSTLTKEFMNKDRKKSQWNKLYMFLIGQVVDKANALLNRDPIDGDAAKALDEVAELFGSAYGEPDDDNGGNSDKKKEPPDKKPSDKKPQDRDKEKQKRFRRHVTIKVRDKTYVLYRGMSLPPYVFAEVNTSNPRHINVNVRGEYRALPTKRESRQEHILMQVLNAIGRSEFPQDPPQSIVYANTLRSELMSRRK